MRRLFPPQLIALALPVLAALSCTGAGTLVRPDPQLEQVRQLERVELAVAGPARARFTLPSKDTVEVGAFDDGDRWLVRFTPQETGVHSYTVEAIGGEPRALARGRFDEIFEAAEKNGVYVVLTAYAIGFSPDDTWKSWDDNPYSVAAGGPLAEPHEFFSSRRLRDASTRRLKYILARWSHSPNLLAIDLLNEPEWDGGIARPPGFHGPRTSQRSGRRMIPTDI